MKHIMTPNGQIFEALFSKFKGHFNPDLILLPQFLAIAIICLLSVSMKKYWENKTNPLEPLAKILSRHLDIHLDTTKILLPLSLLILSGLLSIIVRTLHFELFFIYSFTLLCGTWLLLKLLNPVIKNKKIYLIAKITLFSTFLFHITGTLNEMITVIDGFGFQWKDRTISLFFLIKASILLYILFTAARLTLKIVEKNIANANGLDPSVKAIMSKFAKFGLFGIVCLLTLDIIGIDLTALTVFSGAIGIGIGFGLQKIFSNFISGIILLSDRSIKPGDVIGIGSTYGWVNALGARYVSIITRDGKEHLIPNETMITSQVENWSFSNTDVRIRIPLRVSYQTDIHQALRLIVGAASNIPRILKQPEPKCLVRSFGPYAIELELRVWINDPAGGMGSIQSEILLGVLDAFKAHNIEVPVPMYDVSVTQKNSGLADNMKEDLSRPTK